MSVRMAAVQDIENLIRLRFDFFIAENWIVTEAQHTIIEAALRQYFTAHLNTNFFAAFVEEKSRIISTGFLAVSEKPASISFPTGKTGTILNVLTYPEYRRKGFAASVLQLLIEEAKRQNLSCIQLSATESGKPLYQKLGFQKVDHSLYTEMKLFLL